MGNGVSALPALPALPALLLSFYNAPYFRNDSKKGTVEFVVKPQPNHTFELTGLSPETM